MFSSLNFPTAVILDFGPIPFSAPGKGVIAKFGQLKPSHHLRYAIVFDEQAGTEVAQAGVGYRRRPYRTDRREAPSPC